MKTNAIVLLALMCAAFAASAPNSRPASAASTTRIASDIVFTIEIQAASALAETLIKDRSLAKQSLADPEGAPINVLGMFTSMFDSMSNIGSALAGLGLVVGVIVVFARQRSRRIKSA